MVCLVSCGLSPWHAVMALTDKAVASWSRLRPFQPQIMEDSVEFVFFVPQTMEKIWETTWLGKQVVSETSLVLEVLNALRFKSNISAITVHDTPDKRTWSRLSSVFSFCLGASLWLVWLFCRGALPLFDLGFLGSWLC